MANILIFSSEVYISTLYEFCSRGQLLQVGLMRYLACDRGGSQARDDQDRPIVYFVLIVKELTYVYTE